LSFGSSKEVVLSGPSPEVAAINPNELLKVIQKAQIQSCHIKYCCNRKSRCTPTVATLRRVNGKPVRHTMKSTFLFAVLIAGAFIQCSQSAQLVNPVDAQLLDWSGDYHFGGRGFGASLELKQSGSFQFSSTTCLGPPRRAEGSWSISGDWVELSQKFLWIREGQEVGRLKLVVEGQDQYLIPEGFNVTHLERGWKPLDAGFVLGGFARRRILEREKFLEYAEDFSSEMKASESWCGTCEAAK
jgi:hypothetical protein